jgi:hypothetical protein
VTGTSNTINYSVRQNKTIERSIVFDGLRKLVSIPEMGSFIYVGLGSVWFVDFDHAHRDLRIETMFSFESDDITFRRANFNKPFRTVKVIPGLSFDELPKLLERRADKPESWLVWLDYDASLDPSMVEELSSCAARLPSNSILLTTLNADPRSYGDTPGERAEKLQALFGDAFPIEDYPDGKGLNKTASFQTAMARSLLDLLDSKARSSARDGRFVPAFNLHYQDGVPMVTVGGVLPDSSTEGSVVEIVDHSDWRGHTAEPIISPALTSKEVAALRTLLPADVAPTRTMLRDIGFDLPENKLRSFVTYYLEYPIYVQASR